MERNEFSTPVKLHPNGDDIAVATPSGGLIFNPFHKEFLNRVGQATFSPGIFAYTQSPVTKDGSKKDTPSHFSLPFMLSPDTQGILFPVEIDDNPVLQLKLQEKLDTQSDDEVQDTIQSFFKSHMIAPSPDTVDQSADDRPRGLLPRTSSIIPTVTPRVKRKPPCQVDSAPILLTEVGTQTAVSLPPDFDLVSVLRNALIFSSEDSDATGAASVSDSAEATRCEITCEASLDEILPKRLTCQPSLTACTVQRPMDEDSNSQLFHCVSCRKPHPLSHHSRRSLFSDSDSSIAIENGYQSSTSFSYHRTLVPEEPMSIQPAHSTYLSSSVLEGCESVGDREDSENIESLLTDSPQDEHICSYPSGLSDPEPMDSGNTCSRCSFDVMPSTPPTARLVRLWPYESSEKTERTNHECVAEVPTAKSSDRNRFSHPSPFLFRDAGGLASPNLSPILPASKPVVVDNSLDDCFMKTPTARPFDHRTHLLSPIPRTSLNFLQTDRSPMDHN